MKDIYDWQIVKWMKACLLRATSYSTAYWNIATKTGQTYIDLPHGQ